MVRRICHLSRFLLILNGVLAVSARGVEPSAADLEFFEKRVRPVLVERCYKCHSKESEKVKGHLLLDTREGWQKGGDGGPPSPPPRSQWRITLQNNVFIGGSVASDPRETPLRLSESPCTVRGTASLIHFSNKSYGVPLELTLRLD